VIDLSLLSGTEVRILDGPLTGRSVFIASHYYR